MNTSIPRTGPPQFEKCEGCPLVRLADENIEVARKDTDYTEALRWVKVVQQFQEHCNADEPIRQVESHKFAVFGHTTISETCMSAYEENKKDHIRFTRRYTE